MPPININSAITEYSKVASNAAEAVTLIAEHGGRLGLMIYNGSTAILYCRIDGNATTSDYSFAIPANSLYEMPQGYFTDKVTGIWASENGSAFITQIRK